MRQAMYTHRLVKTPRGGTRYDLSHLDESVNRSNPDGVALDRLRGFPAA